MSRLPDKFLIVRHGARLDETMPAELFREVDVGYDTPLTYGGWKQSQALGAYIAQLLLLPGNPDRRRKRIVIHTSPFARCVQTSIGIAAGIAQVVPPVHGLSTNEATGPGSSIASPYSRIALRLDPWLGEWMTEDYFSHWDAALLRSSEIVSRARALLTSAGQAEGIRLDPKVVSSRIITTGEQGTREIPVIDALNIQSLVSARGKTYVAPVPNHAVLATDAIPKGYVAHARDGCVDFDQTWVGLRDGGDYGEDWSVFHRRIGSGIEALLQWFLVHRYDSNQIAHPRSSNESNVNSGPKDTLGSETVKNSTKRLSDMSLESISEDKEHTSGDDDDELIVILVTHAGGCNKLLHFFTHKPVLIDFPQSSLTLAIKNSEVNGVGDLETLSNQYKVVMQASTDHLNPSARFKTIKDLASANIQVTRHSRSTSRSSRRTTLTSIASVTRAPPTGLWGQSRPSVSDHSSAAPTVNTLWGQSRSGQAESGSVSATATTYSDRSTSQDGLWRPGGTPVRRATTNDVNADTRT